MVSRSSVKGILRWTQRALFAGSIGLLGYCCFVLLDSYAFQGGENLAFEQLLAARKQSSAAPVAASDGLIGRIQIERLGVSAIVMEGTADATLRRAVGHIAGTPLPGQPGNAGISGHRDTFFRPLRNIRQNDVITVSTLGGEYRYRVLSTKIVDPDDVAVLDPSTTEVLTLVTCYPFYFIGSAPHRFIVRAARLA